MIKTTSPARKTGNVDSTCSLQVRECVLRLLCAPEPAYMEKYIYVCDDGHAKPQGPQKRAAVGALRALGALPLRV